MTPYKITFTLHTYKQIITPNGSVLEALTDDAQQSVFFRLREIARMLGYQGFNCDNSALTLPFKNNNLELLSYRQAWKGGHPEYLISSCDFKPLLKHFIQHVQNTPQTNPKILQKMHFAKNEAIKVFDYVDSGIFDDGNGNIPNAIVYPNGPLLCRNIQFTTSNYKFVISRKIFTVFTVPYSGRFFIKGQNYAEMLGYSPTQFCSKNSLFYKSVISAHVKIFTGKIKNSRSNYKFAPKFIEAFDMPSVICKFIELASSAKLQPQHQNAISLAQKAYSQFTTLILPAIYQIS